MAARGVFTPVDGGHEPVVAPRFSRTPGRPPAPWRRPGQDTSEILAGAGFSSDDIAGLMESGAVRQS
jgi:alpha-methylacyl-CoA racemase